jgi:hypothetical protein
LFFGDRFVETMTNPEPRSSPEYDPYELFKDELDLDFDVEAESEQSSTASIDTDATVAPDDDRLYTDEVIRQNEAASRFLFASVIAAGVISVGFGLWYLLAVRQATSPQQTTPLQVPEQPPLTPLPTLPPNLSAPTAPSRPLPPVDAVPGTSSPNGSAPSPNPTVPGLSGTTPPPPPASP